MRKWNRWKITKTNMDIHDFMDDSNEGVKRLQHLIETPAHQLAKEGLLNRETTLTPHYLWNEKIGVIKEWTTN